MGLFVGDDRSCYEEAAALSLEVNFTMVPEPLEKWSSTSIPRSSAPRLGNKSIYRTRMAIADNGELIVLAPAVAGFGEDEEIDRLIRKYGYKGTPKVLSDVEKHKDLKDNLSAAVYLIHGSSRDGSRSAIAPASFTREEIEQVGYEWGDLQQMLQRYPIESLKDGWNTDAQGERFYTYRTPPSAVGARRPLQ